MSAVSRRFLLGVLAAPLILRARAEGVETHVLSSGSFTEAYRRLTPEFERRTGHRLASAFGASFGPDPTALPLAWFVVGLETIGGLMIALGLLTRPVAFIAAGHLAFIAFVVSWPNGFSWARSGWEYPAMWAAVFLFVAVRGGGTWSLDRLLFRR